MFIYWTVVTVFASAILVADGFNLVNETFKSVSRPGKQQPGYAGTYHFGNTFLWDKGSGPNDTSLIIGALNVPTADLPLIESQHEDTKKDIEGEMFACNIGSIYANDTCDRLRSSPFLAKQLSGSSMLKLDDGSLLSCIPTQDLHCEDVIYKPGYCFRSSDKGETWLPQTTSKHHECPVLNIDVMFVLDGSASIGRNNFGKVRDWVVNISAKFDIDGGKVQVGVMQFSHWFDGRKRDNQPTMAIEVGLGRYNTSHEFAEAVTSIKLHGYTTYTAHALNVTAEEFQKSERFNQTGTKKVLILLTDGASHDFDMLPATGNYIRSLGIVPYAIGVGQAVQKELRIIATGDVDNPDFVYEVGSFNDLQQIVSDLQTQILKTDMEGSVATTSASYEMEMAEIGFSSSRSANKKTSDECGSGEHGRMFHKRPHVRVAPQDF